MKFCFICGKENDEFSLECSCGNNIFLYNIKIIDNKILCKECNNSSFIFKERLVYPDKIISYFLGKTPKCKNIILKKERI